MPRCDIDDIEASNNINDNDHSPSIPQVKTTLTIADRIGGWKSRWGIRRMNYNIEPGLYKAGSPTEKSPVLVTANYKMSFDRLRSNIEGVNAWILVVDTKGVNVWCSAGKGVFNAEEIIYQLETAHLERVVSHRTIIVPQLCANGVNADIVRKRSGFRAVFGPVRAEDIKRYLEAGMKADTEMRRMKFTLIDRAVLIPIEIILSAKYHLPAIAFLILISGFSMEGYQVNRLLGLGLACAGTILGAWLFGAIVTPLLLPWLPGRMFSTKGLFVGIIYMLAVYWFKPNGLNWAALVAMAMIILAMTSNLALNFTGASTFTSLSGVKREMRMAIPVQSVMAVGGLTLWITGLFI